MLVFPNHNLLIITPPKTAGKTLRRFFCGQSSIEAYEVVGPVAGDRTSSHSAQIPDDYGSMRRAVVARHPLDRIVSLWHHLNEWWAFHGEGSPDFAEFVDRLASGYYQRSVFGKSICEILGDTTFDEVIHFEFLEADLRRLGLNFEGTLPCYDSSTRRRWQDYFDETTYSTARSCAEADMFRFGYEENGLKRDLVEANYLTPLEERLPNRRELLRKLPRNAVGAEVGVFCGNFSLEILEVCSPKKLYLIDQWTEGHRMELYGKTRNGFQALQDVKQNLSDPISQGRVELCRGDSLSRLAVLPDESLDWVYLDTSHFYYDTFAELCLCAQKVKSDGFICGHDYCEIFEHGVVRAVALFCDQFDYEMVYLTQEEKLPALHRFGLNATVPPKVSYDSFAIRKKNRT